MMMAQSEKLRQKEEFVMCARDFKVSMEKGFIDATKNQCIFDKNEVLRAHSYLIVAYKNTRNVVNVMMEHN